MNANSFAIGGKYESPCPEDHAYQVIQNWQRTFKGDVKNINFPYIYTTVNNSKMHSFFSTKPLALNKLDSTCTEDSECSIG